MAPSTHIDGLSFAIQAAVLVALVAVAARLCPTVAV
jgi:hypothetical protein